MFKFLIILVAIHLISKVECGWVGNCEGKIEECKLNYNESSETKMTKNENLKTIEIIGNSKIDFVEIPFKEIAKNFPNVTKLDIKKIIASELDWKSFDKISSLNLKNLSVTKSEIQSLSSNVFSNFKELHSLDLSHCKIQKLHDNTFQGLINLELLDMNHNYISYWTNEIFLPLKKMDNLKLKSNSVKELPEKFLLQNKNLKKLDLGDNQISKIPESALESFSRLIFLDLADNECVDQVFEYDVIPRKPELLLNRTLFPLCREKIGFDTNPAGRDFTDLWYSVGFFMILLLLVVICTIFRIIRYRAKRNLRQQDVEQVTKTWQVFANKCTIHGVQYLAEERHYLEKIFWIILFVIAITASGYFVFDSFQSWRDNPVVISLDFSKVRLREIPFPAITICAGNRFDKFRESANLNCTGNKIDPTKIGPDQLEQLEALSFICPRLNKLLKSSRNSSEKLTIDIAKNLKVAQEMPWKSKTLHWKGYDATQMNYFTEVLTEWGYCSTFNFLDEREIFNKQNVNESFLDDFELDPIDKFERIPFLWSPDKGYDPDARFKTYPLRSLQSGETAGFELELKVKAHENHPHCACDEESRDFKVTVQHPGEAPHFLSKIYHVGSNEKLTMIIKPRITKTDQQLDSYNPSLKQCYMPNEHNLKFFKYYTIENCEVECLASFTLEVCACVPFYMPRANGTRICYHEDMSCVNIAKKSTIIAKIHRSLNNNGEIGLCDCLPPCFHVDYNLDISKSNLKQHNLSGGSTTKIIAYFDSDEFIPLDRSERTSITDFLSSVGGLLGLFMGVSIFSILELVYHFTIRYFLNPVQVKSSDNNKSVKRIGYIEKRFRSSNALSRLFESPQVPAYVIINENTSSTETSNA